MDKTTMMLRLGLFVSCVEGKQQPPKTNLHHFTRLRLSVIVN